MTAPFSLLYIVSCGALAWLLRWKLAFSLRDRTCELLLFVCLFMTIFFAGYYALGYINLATGLEVVNILNAVLIITIALVAALLMPAPPEPPKPGPAGPPATVAPDAGWLVKLTGLTFLLAAVMLAFGYPQGYEVNAYHLPAAVHQLQSQTLRAWDGNYPHTFPANASIYYAFLLGALPEKLVSAGDLLLLAALAVALFGVCRLTGADRPAALLVCCGLLSVPMIAFSSVELGADIGGLACVAMALYFVLTHQLTPMQRATLAGLCAGLAFGFKSLHLISAAVFGMLLCAQAWRRDGPLRAGGLGLVFVAAGFGTASFWLVRNGIDYRNPFYPVNLPLLGTWFGWQHATDVDLSQRHATQFEWVRTPADWLFYPWKEWHAHGQNFKHSGGLGPFIAASVPVALLMVLVKPRLLASVRAAKGAATPVAGQTNVGNGTSDARPIDALLPLLLATLVILGVWWLLDDRQPRYALPALVYCLPLVAWMLTQSPPAWRVRQNALFSACIVIALLIFLSRQALLFTDHILIAHYQTRSQFYEYPGALDHLPAGATVLNLADRSWHYPLAGAGLSNRVVSMPEARRLSGQAAGLAPPPQAPLHGAALQAAGITHLFITGTKLIADPCVRLREIGRYDRNPGNGQQLAPARVLYAIDYRDCSR